MHPEQARHVDNRQEGEPRYTACPTQPQNKQHPCWSAKQGGHTQHCMGGTLLVDQTDPFRGLSSEQNMF